MVNYVGKMKKILKEEHCYLIGTATARDCNTCPLNPNNNRVPYLFQCSKIQLMNEVKNGKINYGT